MHAVFLALSDPFDTMTDCHGYGPPSPLRRRVSQPVPVHARRVSLAARGCPGAGHRVSGVPSLSVTAFSQAVIRHRMPSDTVLRLV